MTETTHVILLIISGSEFKAQLPSIRYQMSKELKTKECWEELLEEIDTVLFDCDGVLWTGPGDPVPGARDALDFLRSKGKKLGFVTNNSSKSRQEYMQRFQKLGMTVYEEEVFCVGYVAAHYLKHSLQLQGKVYLIGMTGFGHELQLHGIPYTGPGEDSVVDNIAGMLQTPLDQDITAVVVGYDHHFNLMKLMKAISYLQNPACHFIATNEDPFLPSVGSIKYPGTGCIVRAVAIGAEREPIVLGKPHPPLMKVIEESTHLDRTRTLMVGDRLNTDIQFGRENGMKTLLVMTGVTQQSDLEAVPTEQTPHYYCHSVANILI